jgi:hypothetical protein
MKLNQLLIVVIFHIDSDRDSDEWRSIRAAGDAGSADRADQERRRCVRSAGLQGGPPQRRQVRSPALLRCLQLLRARL